MKTTSKIILISQIQTNPAFPTTLPLEAKIKVSDIPILVHKITTTRGKLSIISYEIISGHARLEAAKNAGLKEISCLVYDDAPELIEKLQRLDWAHAFGEHGILKHRDAYVHYKKLKGEYLKRKLSPELETKEAWETCIQQTLETSLRNIFLEVIGEDQIGLIDELIAHIKTTVFYKTEIKKFVGIFSSENFQLNHINSNAESFITFVATLLTESTNDLTWINLAPINLPIPTESLEKFEDQEAFDLLNLINQAHPNLYSRHTNEAIQSNRDGLVTQGNLFYAKISANRTLNKNANGKFTQAFLDNLIFAIKELKGQNIATIYQHRQYIRACLDDYKERLQKQFNRLYNKIRNDSLNIAITRDYIENCFDSLTILNNLYSVFTPTAAEKNDINQHMQALKDAFVDKIEIAINDESRVRSTLLEASEYLTSDIDIRSESINNFHHNLLSLRNLSTANYQYADSDKFNVTNTAELLGFLLFMQRSYKHFVKNKIASNNVFLKKRQSFSVIKDHLSDDKHYVTSDADGITDFIFMIQLANLGTVTTELKISAKGKYDCHVKQFASYREKEQAAIYVTGKAMIAKHDANITGDLIDQTLSQWMGNILKLEKPAMDNWPEEIQTNALRLFRVYVFTMFYIEGLRNPAAFVIHPKLLNELVAQQL